MAGIYSSPLRFFKGTVFYYTGIHISSMKAIPFLSGVLLLLALGACQNDTRQNTEREKNQPNTQRESPVKLIEYLVGDWQSNDATGNRNDDQQSLGEELTFT